MRRREADECERENPEWAHDLRRLASAYECGELGVHPNEVDWGEVEDTRGDAEALVATFVGWLFHNGEDGTFRATLTPDETRRLDTMLLHMKVGTVRAPVNIRALMDGDEETYRASLTPRERAEFDAFARSLEVSDDEGEGV
jgi:hypothetical protein